MNLTEATAAQAVLRTLTQAPQDHDVREAALILADRSHARLGAGTSAAQLLTTWGER